MQRYIVLVVLACCSAAFWLLQPYLLLPSGTTTISLFHAADTFRQCSREVPTGHGSYWLPTAEQIAALEMQMIRLMSERERAGLTLPYPGQRFNGQYIGFTRNGVRHIYGNFFPSYESDAARWTAHWSPFEKPVIVCDGGRNFWGIVYNPTTRQLEQPVFNGPGA